MRNQAINSQMILMSMSLAGQATAQAMSSSGSDGSPINNNFDPLTLILLGPFAALSVVLMCICLISLLVHMYRGTNCGVSDIFSRTTADKAATTPEADSYVPLTEISATAS